MVFGRPTASRPASRVRLAYSRSLSRSSPRACSRTVASSRSSGLPSRARASVRRMAEGVIVPPRSLMLHPTAPGAGFFPAWRSVFWASAVQAVQQGDGGGSIHGSPAVGVAVGVAVAAGLGGLSAGRGWVGIVAGGAPGLADLPDHRRVDDQMPEGLDGGH